MMNRRKVLQIGFALAATAVLPAQAAPPVLKATITLRRDEGGLYLAEVQIQNTSDKQLDVLQTIGTGPGFDLNGHIGKLTLVPIINQAERMSRAAPRQVWKPVAPGQKLLLGACRMRAEGGPRDATSASFDLKVKTYQGVVELKVSGVKLPEA